MLNIKIGRKLDMMVHIFQSQHFGDRDREISVSSRTAYSNIVSSRTGRAKNKQTNHILTAFEIQSFLLHFIASAFMN